MNTIKHLALALLFTAATLAIAQPAAAPQPKQTADAHERSAEAPVATYKLEYNIYETEAGKRINTRSYTLMVTDNTSSQIKTGSRVPITTSSSSADHNGNSPVTTVNYQDIGIMIDARISRRNEPASQPVLRTNIEMSSIAPEQSSQGANPIIRSSRAESNTIVSLKKPIMLSSIDDSLSKRSYQVEVTITQQ